MERGRALSRLRIDAIRAWVGAAAAVLLMMISMVASEDKPAGAVRSIRAAAEQGPFNPLRGIPRT